MSWTDERVELLKKMWGEGQSASQIAKELGGVTRNAVIGKVHRLGLSNRSSGGGSTDSSKTEAKAKPAAQERGGKAQGERGSRPRARACCCPGTAPGSQPGAQGDHSCRPAAAAATLRQ